VQVKDKIIWITGASSGIGEALAKECYRQGAKIILSGRNKDKLEQIKASLQESPSIYVLPLDLGNHKSLALKADEAFKKWGRLDILVNNGGVSQRSLLSETELDVIRHIMDVNFVGTALLSREAAKIMMQQKSGYILMVSSVAGKFSTPYRTIYSASKMALQGLCDGLRAELWEYGIHLSLIVPGFVRTNISLNALEGAGQKHGVMDPNQEKGISPESAAMAIIKGIRKEKREIYMGLVLKTRVGLFLARFFPGLLAKSLRSVKVT